MSPSGDMPNLVAQDESFSLANMIPQHPCSNQGLWSGIEAAVRGMTMRQGEVFVVTGPIYSRSSDQRLIGVGVAVPDQVFKAIYDPVTDQWLVNGQPIAGATGTSYTPTLADLGRTIAVRATASLPGYTSATVATVSTTAVSKQVQNALRPRLKGTAKVGERLTVKPGDWRPLGAVKFRYRWYADGQRIRGARDNRLKLTLALKGTKIVCQVTGSAPGLVQLPAKTSSSKSVKR